MRVKTARSSLADAKAALDEIESTLGLGNGQAPSFLMLSYAVGLDGAALWAEAARRYPQTALHGGSSCLGVLTDQGFDLTSGHALAAFALWDGDGNYGTASADLGDNPLTAARAAVVKALEMAGRPGEIPDLVWLTVSPGSEEAVLAGLHEIVGHQTLIVGGSAADNSVEGKWNLFGPGQWHRTGLVVSVFFSPGTIRSVYQSGYTTAGPSGILTRVEGRRLYEIDGRPAAEVYREWTGGDIPEPGPAMLPIIAQATRWPLGRVTRHLAGIPFHLLGHPATLHPDGSLTLFKSFETGDRIWQMWGSDDHIVARAGRVAQQARGDSPIHGALLIYCGGCALAVRNRMDELHHSITEALGDTPWIMACTFGEQGMPPGSSSEHGNLMMSCTVFAD